MKREDLEKLGITDAAVVDKIMALHGLDIEAHKAKVTGLEEHLNAAKDQLSEANTTIEGFKKLDVAGIQKAADDWKTKAEKLESDSAAALAQLKFDHALEKALSDAKVKDVASVKVHLKLADLKLTEDGSLLGLDKQLEALRTSKDFLFAPATEEKTPQLVLGAQGTTGPQLTAFEIALRKGAQLPIEGTK